MQLSVASPGRLARRPLLAVVLAGLGVLAGAAEAAPSPTSGKAAPASPFALVGAKLIPPAELRALLSPFPSRIDRTTVGQLRKRVLAHYHKRGYSSARAWVIEQGPSHRGPRFTVHIDEGKLERITFVGAGVLRTLVLQVEFYLPNKVFHAPSVDHALERCKKRYSLANAYYWVQELEPPERAPDGTLVPRRELRVYLVSRQARGWGLGIALSSTYGVVPSISFADSDAMFDGDRIELRFGVSFPYRQYLFTESPEFVWVHGFGKGTYRLPSIFAKRLQPAVEGSYEMSRLGRSDLVPPLRGYLQNRGTIAVSAELRLSPILALGAAVGFASTTIWDITVPDDVPTSTYPNQGIEALLLRASSKLTFDQHNLRTDLRTELNTQLEAEIAPGKLWVAKGTAQGQYVRCFGFHCLLVQAQGMLLAGQVNYWNQRPLADFLRVFFDNRFWIEEAFSVQAAFRFALWGEKAQLGIFHDLAVFADRRDPENTEPALANAFGPSLHLLLFDVFALDLYYGFGFAPGGFDHNLVFRLEKVF